MQYKSRSTIFKAQGVGVLGTLLAVSLPVHARNLQAAPDAGKTSLASPISEIVVTATRRATTKSRVPMSIAALGQKKLAQQGVRSVGDLMLEVPGVTFTKFGSTGSNLSVRGISSTTGAGTTGIYIDNTPIQIRSLGSNPRNVYPNMFMIQRVEVLRGPQGTLFGAGAEGGAVRFITPKPNLYDRSARMRAEWASTANGAPSYEAGAAGSLPLIEGKLGFQVAAFYRRDGGYVDRVRYMSGNSGEEDSNKMVARAGRIAFRWKPTDAITITPSFYYQKLNSYDTNRAWEVLSDTGDADYVSGNISPSTNVDKFMLSALDIEVDFDSFTLVSTTSTFNRDEDGFYDYSLYDLGAFIPPSHAVVGLHHFYSIADYAPLNYSGNGQDNWSQEIRLSNNNADARVTWVAGLYFANSEQTSSQSVINDYFGAYLGMAPHSIAGPIYDEHIHATDKQKAIFGQVTYRITDGLRLTAGLRYSDTSYNFRGALSGFANANATTVNMGSESEEPVTPKIGLEYRWSETDMVYATAAKGYRIGGANRAIPPTPGCTAALQSIGFGHVPVEYGSDYVWSYEIGSKDRFLHGQLQLATSIYYVKWRDIIRSVAGFHSCPYAFITNLGSATSKGFDLELHYAPTSKLTVSALVGYNNAEFDETIRAAGAAQPLVTAGHTLGSIPWKVTLGARYDFSMGTTPGFVRADYVYHSSNDGLTPTRDPNYLTNYDPAIGPTPEQHNLRLRAGVDLDSGVRLAIFVDNALNDAPKLGRGRGNASFPIFTYTAVRPRTIGMTVAYHLR